MYANVFGSDGTQTRPGEVMSTENELAVIWLAAFVLIIVAIFDKNRR
ncbi:MAG: hypothetical protein JJE51_03465 [Thermoanaerobaculia bacterium]|nr:hypothetical protein [Thermoanaerobaculia bacterium]